MLPTLDVANSYVEVQRKVKQDGKFSTNLVKKPSCIQRYNEYMHGVDKSDQHLAKYNLLRKCIRWWKILFYHMIDIAVVNGFILFQQHRKLNKDNIILHRPKTYALLDFREAVIRQLADLKEYVDPPKSNVDKKYFSEHLPVFTDEKRNCKLFYLVDKTQLRVHYKCNTPQCNAYLHVLKDENCFEKWHSTYEHVVIEDCI